MKNYNMRAHFGMLLYDEMKKNDKIRVISIDLGFVLFDKIKKDFPDRFLNCGAAEQSAIGIAAAWVLEGYLPIVYSISSFLLFRPAEYIRNYMGYEGLNIKLVGSGVNDDYKNQGQTHWAFNLEKYCDYMEIECYLPDENNFVKQFDDFIKSSEPGFLGLRK